MISLSVNGAAGRMGRQLLAAIGEHEGANVGAAADAPGQACIGLDTSVLAGGDASGINVADNVAALEAGSDVIIDFTAPAVSLALLDALQDKATAVVIGTTGFSGEQLVCLQAHAAIRPILFAPNYSVGVTVTLSLLQQAARALGDDYDVEIIEAHHRHKVDAPSGTALKMGEVVAEALGRDLASCAVYGREGITGARDSHTIGRFRNHPRRRYHWRSYGSVCRQRRANRDHPQGNRQNDVCSGSCTRRNLAAFSICRFVRHDRCAGIEVVISAALQLAWLLPKFCRADPRIHYN